MSETTELKNSIMYLACTINKGNVRNCEECANRDDCMLKEKKRSMTLLEVILSVSVGILLGVVFTLLKVI